MPRLNETPYSHCASDCSLPISSMCRGRHLSRACRGGRSIRACEVRVPPAHGCRVSVDRCAAQSTQRHGARRAVWGCPRLCDAVEQWRVDPIPLQNIQHHAPRVGPWRSHAKCLERAWLEACEICEERPGGDRRLIHRLVNFVLQ